MKWIFNNYPFKLFYYAFQIFIVWNSPIFLNQHLSSKIMLLLWRHYQLLETLLIIMSGSVLLASSHVEAELLLNILQGTRQHPTTKNYMGKCQHLPNLSNLALIHSFALWRILFQPHHTFLVCISCSPQLLLDYV